jgi:hypothetical protein
MPQPPRNRPRLASKKQPTTQTAQMYRYTDDKGAVVTGNSIAPEYARKGYQIVTITGVVLQTVPPEPTAEEREKIAQDNQNKLSADPATGSRTSSYCCATARWKKSGLPSSAN